MNFFTFLVSTREMSGQLLIPEPASYNVWYSDDAARADILLCKGEHRTTMKREFPDFALAGLFTALIFVSTAYLPRIPIGSGGYIHVGDTIVYLAASFLPGRLAAAAGGLGGALADILSGFALWAPFTVFIKMGLALLFTNRSEKLLCKRNIAALFAAFPVTAGGYYVAEWILTGSASVPLLSLPYNLFQAAGSAILYFCIAAQMDRARLKSRLRQN
jgi:uncharacterized repeat protein (TIGR04002 family)